MISSAIRRPGLRAFSAFVALVTLAQASTGCLSHQYELSHDELVRLAQLPPEKRGEHVHAVQKLGERRAPPVAGVRPLPPPYDYDYEDAPPESWAHVDGNVNIDLRSGSRSSAGPAGGTRGNPPPVRVPPAAASTVKPVGPSASAPAARPTSARFAPRTSSGGSGGASSFRGGGGGGGGGDEALVLAVVVVAVAVLAIMGLAATEGARYDGEVAVAPGQPLYLTTKAHEERTLSLYTLSPRDADDAIEATINDDEGYGLRLLGRAPLDRRGFAFKVDVGGLSADVDRYPITGLASHLQVGYFPFRWAGALVGLEIAGSDQPDHGFSHFGLSFEGQAFPLHLWRFHLGAALHAGPTLASSDAFEEGKVRWGGGPMLELALTTRLALMARADWSTRRFDDGRWNTSRLITVGLAVY